MDVCAVIKDRLEELGLEQRDLAAAALVTESYISQLLTRKKAPPAVGRTGLYERMNAFLRLPKGQLSAMVEAQRREELKKKLSDPPAPLSREVRELLLRKCHPGNRNQIRDVFEKQAFGELERLVTEKLLDVTKRIVRQRMAGENWLPALAKLRERSAQELRADIPEFLDTDVFNLSPGHCSAFLDALVDSWEIDLKTFGMKIRLSARLASDERMEFQFVEMAPGEPSAEQPGFLEFLRNARMSGDATAEETEFLRGLRFKAKRPSSLYYYRELQNFRDPLHFSGAPTGAPGPRGAGRGDRGKAGPRKKSLRKHRPEPSRRGRTGVD